MNTQLIILDRDGVINQDSDSHIKDPESWIAIPGSLEAIAKLCRADYRVVIVTNQSGISRGLYSLNTLNKIHQKMIDELHAVGGEINAIFFCPHSERDHCACRKPKAGLFRELADRLRCSLHEVYAVGDSIRDLQAAFAAGAKPILVQTGNGLLSQERIEKEPFDEPFDQVPVFRDLAAFVDRLLSHDAGLTRSI